MKQEKVILSFIMVLIGLLVSGAAFYFYQSTKVNLSNSTVTNITAPTPTPIPTIFLSLNNPANESVVGVKKLEISGKASPDAIIIIITESDQQVFKPSSKGNFATTITLNNGQNLIHIQAISPNGELKSIERVFTYSTESF